MATNPGGTQPRYTTRPQMPAPVDITGRVIKLLGKDHIGPDVIRTIAGMGEDVIAVLGAVATGERPASAYERENAVYVLGMLGQDSAVDPLARVLWDPNLNTQVLAARALGRIGHRGNQEALDLLRRVYNGYWGPSADEPEAARPAADSPGGARVNLRSWAGQTTPTPLPPALAMEIRDILGLNGEHATHVTAPQAAPSLESDTGPLP